MNAALFFVFARKHVCVTQFQLFDHAGQETGDIAWFAPIQSCLNNEGMFV